MLFSYKGITKEYKYKRGFIESDSEVSAMKEIKEKENITVIVSMKEVSNIKALHSIRTKFINQLVQVENKINEKTRVSMNKKKEKELKKSRNQENKEKDPKSISEKSPILRGINTLISKAKSEPAFKKREIVVDEDVYDSLQKMFNERNNSESSADYNKEFKVEQRTKPASNQEKGSKLDLSLITKEDSPEIKRNMKIKVKEKEITMFTRRLHIMLSSGVSLLNSLITLQSSSTKNMSNVLAGVIEDIQMGSSLSESIAKYPRQFDTTYVALVSIGEKSGSLEKSLKDIIKVRDQKAKISNKLKVASMYPIAIGIVLVALMAGAFFFFLPQFESLYADQDMEMPLFSQIVFKISGLFPFILIAIGLIIGIFFYIKNKVPEVEFAYRKVVDKLALKLPVISKVNNASYMLSFSSTIALMLDNGIRLSDTLELTKRTIDNIYIKGEIDDVASMMVEGLSFSDAISEQEYFDEILTNVVITGEKSGQMVFSLEQVAEFYQDELTRQIDSMLELVQPVSIVLIGVVLAPIIIAAYLPILDISSGGVSGLE